MKKIVSIIASAALISMLGVGISGCGNSTNSSTQSNSSSQTETSSNTGDSSSESNSDSTKSSSESDTSSKTESSSKTTTSYISTTDPDDEYATGTHHAVVTVKGYDSFTITLNANVAPVTVSNFCKLSNEGYYNGLTFHRVVDEFCLQGGDPNGDGTGGSDDEILGEFSENGVANKLADNYERGTVAMARSTDPNSASSQFFITLSDDASYSLNGKYAAFGTISSKGMKIVDKIVEDCLDAADSSTGTISDSSKQPVIKSIKISD